MKSTIFLHVLLNIVRIVLDTTAFSDNWYNGLINLRHLEFKSDSYLSRNDFLHLLTYAPHLNSLTLPMSVLFLLTDRFENDTVCYYLSTRIKSLTICGTQRGIDDLRLVTASELSSLVNIFGEMCEHLSFGFQAKIEMGWKSLKKMQQLRSLHIRHRMWHVESQTDAHTWVEKSQSKINPSDDFMHASDEYQFYVWFGN